MEELVWLAVCVAYVGQVDAIHTWWVASIVIVVTWEHTSTEAISDGLHGVVRVYMAVLKAVKHALFKGLLTSDALHAYFKTLSYVALPLSWFKARLQLKHSRDKTCSDLRNKYDLVASIWVQLVIDREGYHCHEEGANQAHQYAQKQGNLQRLACCLKQCQENQEWQCEQKHYDKG